MSELLITPHFRSEGDVNTTLARSLWNESLQDESTQSLLTRDSNVFLHQAMSTPCLDSLQGAEGVYLQDTRGKNTSIFTVTTFISLAMVILMS